MVFFSAQLRTSLQPSHARVDRWSDRSTADYHAFESAFGTVRLRKRNSYPKTFTQLDGGILRVGYGDPVLAERTLYQTSTESPNEAVYSEEFFLVEINCLTQTISVQRDAFCTMPLFVAHTKDGLSLANAFDVTCNNVKDTKLQTNLSKLYEFIVDRKTKTPDTIIENCLTLTALERLSWARGNLLRDRLTLAHFSVINNYDGNPRQFRQFLDSLFAEYAQKYAGGQRVACEFSGGIDSAIVAGYLADHDYNPLLVSAGFPGEFQASQHQKIHDFKNRFHTKHIVLGLNRDTAPLFRLLQEKPQPFYQLEGTYNEAAEALARCLVQNGVTAVYNGLGGDDVLARFDFIHQEQSVPAFFTDAFKRYAESTITNESSNMSYAQISNQFIEQKLGCHNVYLNYGIWPIAPFTDPRLFLYCQALKPRFRDNKNIFRMYCEAWQYPTSIYQPVVNEDFELFFKDSMQHNAQAFVKKWLAHSVLIELGMIDKEKLLDYVIRMKTQEEYFHFYKLIVIESNLQMLDIEGS